MGLHMHPDCPYCGRTSEINNVGHAAVANHVVVAQQVAAKGVNVARAVGLVGQLAAAWRWGGLSEVGHQQWPCGPEHQHKPVPD